MNPFARKLIQKLRLTHVIAKTYHINPLEIWNLPAGEYEVLSLIYHEGRALEAELRQGNGQG